VANGSDRPASAGLSSSSASLPLVDLLQVWSMNRFSGLVAVTSGEKIGHLYFVDGEIVHAEAGDVVGEPAVGTILAWPGSAFEPHPNTATLKRTIAKRLSHLLLDAHRIIDEQRRAAPPPAAPPVPAGAPTVLDRIRALAGVTRVVRFGKDGRTAPGEGPAGEELAAKALYLALNHAGAIASAFGLRDVVLASVQGARESFLVVQGGGNYLAVAVGPGVAVEPIAAQVRALLTKPAAR
jgi:hypothetical protein